MTDPAAPQATDRALAVRIWREYLKPRRVTLATAMLSAAIIAALSSATASRLRRGLRYSRQIRAARARLVACGAAVSVMGQGSDFEARLSS